MPEYKVGSVEALRSALAKSHTEDDVVVTFTVADLSADGDHDLRLEKDCKGVTVRGPVTLRGMRFYCTNVAGAIKLRDVRIRVGASHLEEGGATDAFFAEKCSDVTLERCTFSDASDEIVSLNYCDNVVIDRCIVGDPLHIPTVGDKGEQYVHKEGKMGSHGYGLRSSAITNLVITRTLFANCNCRSPQCNNQGVQKKTSYACRVENCVIYNYGDHGFTYNNKSGYEKARAEYKVEFRNNLFVPGPRTNKEKGSDYEAKEFECEQPTRMKLDMQGVDTNKIHTGAANAEMLVLYEGKTSYVRSGQGPTESVDGILDNAGCSDHDAQDATLISAVKRALSSKHQYDNLDPGHVHLLWPGSGWRNFS